MSYVPYYQTLKHCIAKTTLHNLHSGMGFALIVYELALFAQGEGNLLVGAEKVVETGSYVRLSLSNVVCPEAQQITEKITNNLEVTGKVLFLSDAGELRDYYAVVEVNGIMSPLVIPVKRVKMLESKQKDNCSESISE